MADVAREAGVSHQTVSRVLNAHPSVRGETRARVLAAIDKLGYRRNPAARALVTRNSRTFGVVSVDTTLYGPASTVYGIERAARSAGYFVSIVNLTSVDTTGMRDALDFLADQGVDGVIVLAPQRSAAQALTDLPIGIPAVVIEGGQAGDVSVVCVDQVAGGRLATEHLLSLGYETVWHVRGPSDWLEAEGRMAGWRTAIEDAGLEAPEPLAGDWSPHSGYEAGAALAREPDVTAVFVANDQMALGVLRAFSERGIRVPEQVSVVGFDDIPESAFFSPPLTTVRQDFGAVGRRSIEILLRRIEGEGPGERLVVPPSFVHRNSTARPRPPV
ncbi:LacI family DNA-binding transcriptional regulator [Microtetraspora sp. AC03309]|uniref:LacI family DNA-binding transcriptional regulator n=1 Tax=Microtetraspora sp. AC03309 TaxID=2779376 RepID=UPI001E6309F4|nr:LacI family DNA-binding transcriptional regulator [Microtetraspora sp. AC03309]MCC5574889.1 LacI family DNA-binding transcriptional regulator [Microtetraspora sp. AC03309]